MVISSEKRRIVCFRKRSMAPAPKKEVEASFLEILDLHLIDSTNPVGPFALIAICNKQLGKTPRVFHQMDMLACAISYKIIDGEPALAIVARQV